MPLQRLRRVLEANYRVTVESSDQLLVKVNRQVQKRRQDLQAKGAPPVRNRQDYAEPGRQSKAQDYAKRMDQGAQS
jgi:hypothetical protein